ncbi:hypothetical protein K438DRAFT_2127231, partial [Mycena galopus ATCC 62051]
SLAAELQTRWRHASQVSSAIGRRIAQTSRLVGFSSSIFPGQRLGHDPTHGDDVPPPLWLASELGVVIIAVEYDETGEPSATGGDEDNQDLVARELDVEEDDIVQLMDHLSTFDDS